MTLRQWEKLNIFLILFFAASSFAYFLLNGGAFARNIRYALFLNSPLAGDELREEILSVSTSTVAQAAARSAEGMRLIIPKIEVSAPIAIPRDTSNKGVLASLEEGVGLYPNSALPGDVGRTVILGHSSRASWYRGEYAYIFSLLPKLEPGDEFYIVGDGKKYIYRVFSKKILTPAETNALLANPVNHSETNLITCYPIGSASKRTLIQAQLAAIENI